MPKINRRSKSVVKMSFSQRQKQYERNTVQTKQNIIDKELRQFTYSPRINLKSQRIAEKSLTRIPLTERKMKKGMASAIALLMPDDDQIKFYDDTLAQSTTETATLSKDQEVLRGIIKSPVKRDASKRDVVKDCLRRLYKSPGKENRPEYVLTKKPETDQHAAVVIKEYQPKTETRLNIHRKLQKKKDLTHEQPARSISRSRSAARHTQTK